jgi:D-alanyl-D-alanine carboxypeptidase/D-alanyl-D-alanine-endopeptidase (penicillin-binding protein 4)
MWSHLLACALLLLPAQALAGAKEKVAALAPLGLVLVVDEKGDELVAQNADKPFVPASVAKIVTAWLAIEVLGADYRFETRFYLDGDRVLYIRGGGDPFLVSEELAELAPALVAAIGKQPLSGIVLDASYYPSDIRIPGIEDTDEAYDALNSALAVNFNTIHAVRKGNTVHSAEKQTPITPLAISQFPARGAKGRGQPFLDQLALGATRYVLNLPEQRLRSRGLMIGRDFPISFAAALGSGKRVGVQVGSLASMTLAKRGIATTPFVSKAR